MQPIVLLAAAVALIVGGSACSSDCDASAEDARTLRDELAACAGGETCVLVSFDDDCTGVLGCDVAVNEKNETRARDELGRMAKESLDCTSCAMADCRAVTTATCNASSKRCEAN